MKIFSWGANSCGQLGHGVQSEQCVYPQEVTISHPLEDVSAIAAGGSHSLVLNSAGELLGCGSNNSGQLADLPSKTALLTKIKNLQEFKLTQVECGWESSYAVTDNRCLVVWGSNKYGQLGLPKDKVLSTNNPIVLENQNIIQLSAGLRHTAIVTVDGHVWTCGQSNRGQLGVINSDGSLPKKDIESLVKVPGLENIKQVACGQHHTLALTSDGQVFGWGDNRRGQLSEIDQPIVSTPVRLLTTLDSQADVRAGWTHSAVLADGRVTTWGRNNYNQLGHSCGEDQVTTPRHVKDLETVKQLELGSEHCVALLENGDVWTWGWNEHGNCGTGHTDNVTQPQLISVTNPIELIASGAGHCLALSHL